jgi:hypothetical protein
MVKKLLSACAVLAVCAGLVAAQGAGDVNATIKMVDPSRGTALITVMQDNGIRIFEVAIPPDVKIVDPKGKKVKGGLKSDLFKSPNNRPAVPVQIRFVNDNGTQRITKITVP